MCVLFVCTTHLILIWPSCKWSAQAQIKWGFWILPCMSRSHESGLVMNHLMRSLSLNQKYRKEINYDLYLSKSNMQGNKMSKTISLSVHTWILFRYCSWNHSQEKQFGYKEKQLNGLYTKINNLFFKKIVTPSNQRHFKWSISTLGFKMPLLLRQRFLYCSQ